MMIQVDMRCFWFAHSLNTHNIVPFCPVCRTEDVIASGGPVPEAVSRICITGEQCLGSAAPRAGEKLLTPSRTGALSMVNGQRINEVSSLVA